jgi:SRSO17 transposase
MIKAAVGGPVNARWVTCDDNYGRSEDFRDEMAALGLLYVCEVPCLTKVWTSRPALAAQQDGEQTKAMKLAPGTPRPLRVSKVAQQQSTWRSLTVRTGTKKPIRSDWAALRVYPRSKRGCAAEGWLLIERLQDGTHKYYLSNAPAQTPLRELAYVAKQEWFVEQCFRDTKQHVGLGDYEVRKWRAWYHHMTMCLLAYLFLKLLHIKWKKKAFHSQSRT